MGTTILLTLGFMLAAVAMLATRIIFVKGGEFHGTCATNNPLLTDKTGDCSMCKKAPEDRCDFSAEKS